MEFLQTLEVMTEAINNYSQFSPNQRKVLITLLSVSVNNQAQITINDINQLTGVTRATISTALSLFNENGFIQMQKTKGNRFTGCALNQDKFNEIVLHYQARQRLVKK